MRDLVNGPARHRVVASCGLTDGEAAIMDLWDSGLRDLGEIGRKTGYGDTYVETVVRRYSVTDRVLSSFDHMSKLGSASLLAALHKFHPETKMGFHP